MNKILIFSQSPKDIQFVLAIISSKEDETCFFEIIATSKECFSFLSTLIFENANVEIKNYSMTTKGKLQSIFSHLFLNRLKLYQLEKKYIQDAFVKQVYFFSCYFDLLTLSFYLRNKNRFKFHFVDIFKIKRYENKLSNVFGLLKRLKHKYINFMFSNDLEFYCENNKDIVGISVVHFEDFYDRYNSKLRNSLFLSNQYSPHAGSKGKSVIFYDSDYYIFGPDVALVCIAILLEVSVELEKKGFEIFIKEHPRLGGSGLHLLLKNSRLINPKIPSEFIDRSGFEFEFAIVSAALESKEEFVKAVSLIKMLEKRTGVKFESKVNQMNSMNNVILISDIESLKVMLAQHEVGA